MTQFPMLFTPLTLSNGVTLRNRIVMAPMTTWAGNPDGTVAEEELQWIAARAGGVGMVITGCSHVQASGMGFTDEFASYDDRFIPSLARLAQAAKSGGAVGVLQLFHAGNKALPALVPDGRVVSASAVATEATPFAPSLTPDALDDSEIQTLIADFGHATRRAIDAGFDGIELHGAHGFVIQNFLSPKYNQRTDRWGGSLENRMAFALAVVAGVRRVIAAHAKGPFLLGYRISPEESEEGGLRIADALTLTDRLAGAGVSYIHASLSNILEATPKDSDGTLTAQRFATVIAGRVPLIAAGQIRTPDQAQTALGLVSLVAVGQGLAMNPDWVEQAQNGQASQIATALDPALVPALAIPAKLWAVIQAMPSWFKLVA